MTGSATCASAARCPLAAIDMRDPAILEAPWNYFDRLRGEAPVLRDAATGVYQVSSYDLVTTAAADHDTFSSVISHVLHGQSTVSERVRAVMARGRERPATLQTADPPVHTRSRKLVAKAFTLRRVNAIADDIRLLSDRLIDRFADRGTCDLVAEFAQPLPMTIILRQLGVPDAELALARRFNDAFSAQFSRTTDEDAEVAAAETIVDFQTYFADMIEQKRRRPTDDIISDIANATLAEEGDARPLDTPEALQIIQQVLVAGNETTASTVAECMFYLVTNPAILTRAARDAVARASAIEETLRLHSPVQAMWRVAARDTVLGGVPIERGALVLLRFGSANRDEAVFAGAGAFSPDRSALKRHVAFGSGIHFCLGAALGRRELDISIERLLTRLGGWRFAPDAEFAHNASVILRGLRTLHLQFDLS